MQQLNSQPETWQARRIGGGYNTRMATPEIEDPTYVDTPALLEQMLTHLQEVTALAIDTESNSLHAYQEQVCLIQISTREQDFLVDSLALADLSALGSIFADPKIQKVFHAGEYDVLCLKRDYEFTFRCVFDTMIAGRVLGVPRLGLSPGLHVRAERRKVRRQRRVAAGEAGRLPDRVLCLQGQMAHP